jgi:hypothetical protein
MEKMAKPSYILSVLGNKCPRCRKGNLYIKKNPYDLKYVTAMHKNCPECGQPSEIEVGFYYGTSYLSYALTIAFTAVFFILWWIVIGLSIKDNRIFWWLGINSALLIVFQPQIMRFSRMLWLYFFVRYDANWRSNKPQHYDRIVEEHMGNW